MEERTENPADPRARQALRRRLREHFRQERRKLQEAFYREARGGTPLRRQSPLDLAAAHLRKEEPLPEELQKHLRRRSEEVSAEGYLARAILAFQRSDWPAAVSSWKKAVELGGPAGDPWERMERTARARMWISQARRILSKQPSETDLSEAEDLLEKAVGTPPEEEEEKEARRLLEDVRRQRRLRELARQQDRRLEEARRLYEQALWARERGSTAEAIRLLRKSVEQNPEFEPARLLLTQLRNDSPDGGTERAEAHYQKGLAYFASGQPEAAALEWKTSLRLDPKHERARRALERIGQRDGNGTGEEVGP